MNDLPPTLLVIPGNPVGKARPRVTRSGVAYTPKKTREYEQKVAWIARSWWRGRRPIPKGVPVIIHITSLYSRPKSNKLSEERCWCPKGGTYADLDNLVKAIKDSLNGLVYEDDCQVVGVIARKMHTGEGEEPCTEVLITIPDEEDPLQLLPTSQLEML